MKRFNTTLFAGMALQCFACSFCMAFGLVNVTIKQQVTSGFIFLTIAYVSSQFQSHEEKT